MFVKYKIVCNFLLTFFQFVNIGWSQDLKTLKLVQVLFRHGDRYPLWSYPNDPYKNEPIFSPHQMGQLTNVGKRQQFELGRFLRRRYDGFLTRNYSPDEIFVMSSDMDRTIMSAQMNLAGLFEPENLTGNWDPSIDWTPVPIRTIPGNTDKLLGMRHPCPRLKVVAAGIRNSAVFLQAAKEHRHFLDYLRNHTGTKGEFLFSKAAVIRDILLVEDLHNYSLPTWVHGKMDQLTHLTGLDMTFQTITNEAKRLRAGPLLQHILESMEKSSKKFLMYSAHDSTLARIMNALGIFSAIPPPYASALIMELHKDSDNGYFVQTFYKNESIGEPHEMVIPGCGQPCKLESLIKITKVFIPDDWENECSQQNLSGTYIVPPVTGVFIGMGTLLASVLALVIVMARSQKRIEKTFLGSRQFNYESI